MIKNKLIIRSQLLCCLKCLSTPIRASIKHVYDFGILMVRRIKIERLLQNKLFYYNHCFLTIYKIVLCLKFLKLLSLSLCNHSFLKMEVHMRLILLDLVSHSRQSSICFAHHLSLEQIVGTDFYYHRKGFWNILE